VRDEARPDADRLLARVQEVEGRPGRGRLKVFLGYAAGVGKTYAMLQAAHERLKAHVDVVAGWVETHGRVETEALLEGLPALGHKKVIYRDVLIQEFDLDTLLARRPQLVLIDELAHTNAPGSRHRKRHSDIEEVLAAGIDVYTTMNVQHLESLNEVVAQLTGVQVRETVPDRVLDSADEIELIDLPPEDLLLRLKQGKVYIPSSARQAMEGFFRPERLTALREVVLRRVADRVDEQVLSYMQLLAISGPWPARERLLVCIGPSPYGQSLVRGCARLAQGLHAPWDAVFIETPRWLRASPEEEARVDESLRLAESLGGRAVRLAGDDVARTVVEHARRHNTTKIIVGKPQNRRAWSKPNLVDRVISISGPVDIYVINTLHQDEPHRPARHPSQERRMSKPLRVLLAILLVTAATGMGEVLDALFHITNLLMLYILVVMLSGLWWGRTPAVVAAFLSVLAFDFFFVPPRFTMTVADSGYLLTFGALFTVGLVVANLAASKREQVEVIRRVQQQTMDAYEFSQDLARAPDCDSVVTTLVRRLDRAVSAPVTVFLQRVQGMEVHPASSFRAVSAEEFGTASWVAQNTQTAGRGTETLSAQEALYLPLVTARGLVGVVRLGIDEPLRQSQWRYVEGIANQAAVALERVFLEEETRRVEVLSETDRLQTVLLNSISHDLQTPIATILGALDSLNDAQIHLDSETRKGLLLSAREEADRLQRLVRNLLQMIRVEAGAARLNCELCEVQDLVGTALQQVESHHPGRLIEMDVPQDLPMVRVDFVLFVQVLVNLLENSIRYAPPDSPIRIRAFSGPGRVHLEVVDHGPGIPPEDRQKVFEKFYRVQREGRGGTGLGLAICRGLVEAHRGRIRAHETLGGGTTIRVDIPLEGRTA